MIPHYISQIVPAPEGWIQNGSPDPGDEFWYESTDGTMSIWPHPDSGWVLEQRSVHPDPQSAFKAASDEH